jgi:hypothetical protein|tara:strand:+ start:5796 stop:6239 length:444 start_codon:yes stop_codon:yes gene_type:complete
MGKRKPFDRKLYNEVNDLSIKAVKKYLTDSGHTITSTKEKFTADIESTYKGKEYLTEAEVKLVWDKEWPSNWCNVRVPERKRKLLEQAEKEGKILTFLYLNKSFTKAWKIDGETVKDCSLEEVPNRFVPKGEYFYIVPVEKATMVNL